MSLAIALVCASAALARADEPQALSPAAQTAQGLFQQGREAAKKGDLERALELFRQSHETYPAAGTLLNLANVEERLGKVASAKQHYELALAQLPPADDDRTELAKSSLARLAPRVPSLRIERAAGAPEDLSIRLEGAAVAASSVGTPQSLDPGTYTITTAARDHEERRYEVKLGEGAHLTLAVEAGKFVAPPAPPPPPPPPPPLPKRSPVQTAGWVVGGVGVAGIGIGVAAGLLALARKDKAASLCPDPSRCDGEGLAAAASGHAFAGVSTASFIVGLAGLGAGVAMVIVGRDKPSPAAATIGPVVLAGGGGIGASGVF